MTVKELSQLYWLRKEIEKDEHRLKELRSIISGPTGTSTSGTPVQGGSAESKIERMVVEIVDLEAIIAAKQIQCIHERARLERYIAGIDDSLTRQIFTLRFADNLSWTDVADRITQSTGRDCTEYAVKKRCYRFLDERNEKESEKV